MTLEINGLLQTNSYGADSHSTPCNPSIWVQALDVHQHKDELGSHFSAAG
jgi:hypothetical protein